MPARSHQPTCPAHHGVEMAMPRVLDALPRARKPEVVWLEVDFLTDEAHMEAVSAIVDPCGVLGRQTWLHFHLPLRQRRASRASRAGNALLPFQRRLAKRRRTSPSSSLS
ncbi:hypothetical protein ACQ4PT_027536 [Festuca glaucescens]